MNTYNKTTLKPILITCILMLVLSFDLSCAPIITPITMPIFGGCGSITYKKIIAMFVSLNAISVFICIIRSLYWVIKKPNFTYKEYVWYSDMELIIPDVNTYWILAVSGLSIILTLNIWIKGLI